jgi:phytoene/squalene synthetase
MSATTLELLEAVRQFLRQEVLPELDGFKAYNTRVAANALGIVARDIELGAGLADIDAQVAAQLGLDAQAGPIARQVALALRDGTLAVDQRLLGYLRERTLLSLAIDNPKYSGLQQARERWGKPSGS